MAAIYLVSVVAGLLWIGLVMEPSLARDYIMEDGFFYIETAHNFGSNFAFTFDGVNATNGFHYLYMILLVVIDNVVPLEGNAGVRAVIFLHGALTIGAAGMAAIFSERLVGKDWRPAVFIAVLAVQGFYSIGTEAALLSLVGFGFLAALAHQQGNLLTRALKRSDGIGVALLATGVCLARSEAVILPLVCGGALVVWQLARDSQKSALWTTRVTILPAVVVFCSVALINVAITGHPITIAAYLKSDFPDLLNNEWLSYKGLSYQLRILFPPIVSGVCIIYLLKRLGSMDPSRGATALCWVGFNVYIVAFIMAIYLFAVSEGTLAPGGVQPYYFDFVLAGTAVNLILMASEATTRVGRFRGVPTIGHSIIRWMPALVAAAILLLGGLRFQRFSTFHPSSDVVNATTGEWLRENLDASDRVLAIDHAGVIGYVSGLGVVNGDGLINSWAYLDALQKGSLESWLRTNQVEYLYVGTSESDPVGSLEMRDGKQVVVARLQLRGTRKYELRGIVGQEVYQAPSQWIFPLSAISFEINEGN